MFHHVYIGHLQSSEPLQQKKLNLSICLLHLGGHGTGCIDFLWAHSNNHGHRVQECSQRDPGLKEHRFFWWFFLSMYLFEFSRWPDIHGPSSGQDERGFTRDVRNALWCESQLSPGGVKASSSWRLIGVPVGVFFLFKGCILRPYGFVLCTWGLGGHHRHSMYPIEKPLKSGFAWFPYGMVSVWFAQILISAEESAIWVSKKLLINIFGWESLQLVLKDICFWISHIVSMQTNRQRDLGISHQQDWGVLLKSCSVVTSVYSIWIFRHVSPFATASNCSSGRRFPSWSSVVHQRLSPLLVVSYGHRCYQDFDWFVWLGSASFLLPQKHVQDPVWDH